MTAPRQTMYVGVHLTTKHHRFDPELVPARPDGQAAGIAQIHIIDGLSVQSDDAAIFRALADACRRAADSIDAATDTASSASRQHYIDTGEYLPQVTA